MCSPLRWKISKVEGGGGIGLSRTGQLIKWKKLKVWIYFAAAPILLVKQNSLYFCVFIIENA